MRRFRSVCRWLHRELGYFAVGLTLVYAISGIAVNHAHHWDANYARTSSSSRIAPVDAGPTIEITPVVVAALGLQAPVKNVWRAAEDRLDVFVEGGQYSVHLPSGEVAWSGFARRPLLYDLNFMHLNTGKGAWTVIADAYAVVLVVLALSGIFLLRGKQGLAGRGGVWLALGVLLPAAYIAVARST